MSLSYDTVMHTSLIFYQSFSFNVGSNKDYKISIIYSDSSISFWYDFNTGDYSMYDVHWLTSFLIFFSKISIYYISIYKN